MASQSTPDRTPQQSALDLREVVSFLLARVSEHETEIRKLSRSSRSAPQAVGDGSAAERLESLNRSLDECAEKRTLIGKLQRTVVLGDSSRDVAARDAAGLQLRTMAADYAEHVSYRPHWQL